MNNTHKLRLTLIFFLVSALSLLAIGNLYFLQIRQHTFFTNLGNQQYHISITNHPPRATIFDRNGKPLALNKDSLSAFILPKTITNKKALTDFLKAHFPQALTQYLKKQQQHFLYIKRRLSADELAIIEKSPCNDINIITEPNRFYPIEEAGIVTGITDTDNKGLFGIEFLYNDQLIGTPSTTILERDARSGKFYFSKEVQSEGNNGTAVSLTIDSNLQFLVQEALQEAVSTFDSSEGGAIVMDPQNGDILALAALPNFNPNNPQNIILNNTKCRPITEVYEFGSVMKTFSALAAIDEQVVTPDEEINCMGVKTTILEGRTINTVPHSVLGIAPFKEIIKKSNNIGIAKVAKRIGTKLYDHYQKLGFGKKTGIAFPGEQSGFIMPPEKWSKQSIISLSYGYEVNSSLLQLARAFSIFVNDGHLVTPRLLLNQLTPPPVKIYSSESIAFMREILEKKATGGAANHGVIEGYTTLGKTGTANLLDHGHYNPHKNLFCFVGSIEKNNYKRVIACYVKESKKHGLYASTVAAPLFQKIAEILIVNDKIW